MIKQILRYMYPIYILEFTHRGINRRLLVKKFDRLRPHYIKGITTDNERFAFKSKTPMDYSIIEYHSNN